MTVVGRNDLCPCGSGKKFKKCCGRTQSITTPPAVLRANAVKELDRKLTERLLKFARRRHGADWVNDAFDYYAGRRDAEVDDSEVQLAMPLALFEFPLSVDGKSIAQVFSEERSGQHSSDITALLDAHRDAWLSVWEVREVERGVGALLADLLTGEERFVHEIQASQTMDVRSAILGRIVDLNEISFICGMHPFPLSPSDADVVVRDMKRLCRVRTRPVKRDRLRALDTQLELLALWRDIAQISRHAPRPTLTNTDGDLLQFTTDHFEVVGADRTSIVARLATFPGAEEPQFDKGSANGISITITKKPPAGVSLENVIVGQLVIAGTRMRVESNSIRRADALRKSLTSHLGDLVRYRLRGETSVDEVLRRAEQGHAKGKREPEQTDEMKAIARLYKERHMTAWPDMELPALGGLTPRQAVKVAGPRARLELLLREFEMHEARAPEDERFDIDRLRETLGMD